MSTPLIPGIGSPTSLLQGVGAGGTPGTATTVPPGLLALPNGTLLRGMITRVQPQGLAVLTTPKGDVTIKTGLPVHIGSEVVLRLDTTAGGLKARIMSVDGQTPRELTGHTATPDAEFNDIIDLAGQRLVNTAPAGGTERLEDTVEVKLPHETLLKAILLSRAPNLPQLLKLLPPELPLPRQRLEAGATLTVKILPQTLQTPEPTQPAQTVLPPSPSPADPAKPFSATPVQSPAPGGLAPASTAMSGSAPIQPTQAAGSPATAPSAPSANTLPAQTGSPIVTETQPTISFAPASNVMPPAEAKPVAPGVAPALPPQPATPNPAATSNAIVLPLEPPEPSIAQVLARVTGTPPQPSQPLPAAVSQGYQQYQHSTQIAGTPPRVAATTLPAVIPGADSMSTSGIRQGLIPAEVIGTEASGETVMRTPLGIIKTDLPVAEGAARAPIPAGTQMTLQIVSVESEASPLDTLPIEKLSALPASLSELSSHWQSLEETLATLTQINPQAAQQFINHALPQAGPKLTTGVLFFMAALTGGDVKAWMGERTVEILEKNQRSDLVRKLGSEFALIRQLFVEAPTVQWQTAFVPFLLDQQLHQARLFIKRDDHAGEQMLAVGGTRFIMEVELSQYGPMQFDGFVRKQAALLNFDLLIRTTHTMPEHDRNAIREIFVDAQQLTGFRGQIGFQVSQPFPTQPMEEILEHDRNLLA